jgi:hydroxymethylglutaryl-CoA lyase
VTGLPKKTTVVDVTARDGLQSFWRWVDTGTKVKIIDRLSEAGYGVIEVTNFAHPRVIPHLRDAEEVMERINRKRGVVYRAQAPNPRGAQRAVAAKAQEILGLITASEVYNRKNQNMSLDQGIDAAIETFRIAERANIPFVLAVGMAWWCAYEGEISIDRLLSLIERLRNGGIERYYFADTMGMENPRSIGERFDVVFDRFPDLEIGFHPHNLAGMGAANVVAALNSGVTSIEGSTCGIGGGIMTPANMPSIGNLPTEDIVYLLNEMSVQIDVETEAALACARDVAVLLDIDPESYLTKSGGRAGLINQAKSHPRDHPV